MTRPKYSTEEILGRLTLKQRIFVEAYLGECHGNAYQSAVRAGYSNPKNSAVDNVRSPLVRAAIEHILGSDPLILSRIERQRFLSDMMRSQEAANRDRLEAAKLLGQTAGDFIQRVDADVRVSNWSQLVAAVDAEDEEMEEEDDGTEETRRPG